MYVDEYRSMAQHMLDSIKGLVQRAPADKLDWAPCEGGMTLGTLLWHVAGSVNDVLEFATGRGPSADEMANYQPKSMGPDEAAALVDEQKALLDNLLEGVDNERWLNEQVTVPWGDSGSMARMAVVGLEHAAGHRYQLFLYLKLLGQQLDTYDLCGMPRPDEAAQHDAGG